MDSSEGSGLGFSRWLSPSSKNTVLVWLLMIGCVWLVLKWRDKPITLSSFFTPIQAEPEKVRELPSRYGEPETVRERRPSRIGPAPDEEEQPSDHAVDRIKVMALTEQVKTLRTNMRKLQAHLSTWQPLSESVLRGDLGRRVVVSPTHLKLAANILEEDRVTMETANEWEQRLELLAEPIDKAALDPSSKVTISDEHSRLISELSLNVASAMQSYSEAESLMNIIIDETASLEPHAETFEEVLRKQKRADEIALAARIEEARQAARREAEQRQIESIQQSEQALVEAETKRQELNAIEKKKAIEAQSKAEQVQMAAEAQVAEAQRQATINGLKEEAAVLAEKLRLAQLEREFERDKAKIEGYLSAFISEGYTLRSDETKGPASLSVIEGQGALEPNKAGIAKLVELANTDPRRPLGPIPYITFFNVGQASNEPIETAQALLTKYGKLMVQKGLLAP